MEKRIDDFWDWLDVKGSRWMMVGIWVAAGYFIAVFISYLLWN